MFSRRTVLAATLVCGAAFALPAQAADQANFTMKAFQAAQAAGKPVVVEVHADWCPVCTKQKPISAQLRAKPEFKNVAFFVVDFDGQADALKTLRVTKQSTMISFKGKAEKSRSTGVTDPAKIEQLFRSAL